MAKFPLEKKRTRTQRTKADNGQTKSKSSYSEASVGDCIRKSSSHMNDIQKTKCAAKLATIRGVA